MLIRLIALLVTFASVAAVGGEGAASPSSPAPTVLACTLSQTSCRPGLGLNITYRWDARPLDKDYEAFVHIEGAKGMLFQGDHGTPVPTKTWSGRIEYDCTLVAPMDAPPGDYRIVMGLWDRKTNSRAKLNPGEGVTDVGGNAYEIGRLKIADDAPLPLLPKPTLNLDGYRLTFDESFKEELSVSASGPGTRWIAHTPYNGDFGDAGFANPQPGFPFTIDKGVLRIEAHKTEQGWRAGLLCSVDPKGAGFSQQFGYFEMRAKLPKGAGVWPAFWLLGVNQLKTGDKSLTNVEIDVLEEYGVNPNVLHSTVHLWHPGGKDDAIGKASIVTGMTDDFHNYGVQVQPDFITIYFDGSELQKFKTPEEAKVPVYLLVDLALGGGWPIDKTPSPSYMYVEHIRAYAK